MVSEGNPVVPGGFAPGARIAGYLLEEQIGQGGMAVVFRAHDERLDHIYLSDFGLSKGSLQASGLTGTGTFLGTLDYIAPEQIEGKPVDGRADEYALACAAFELLTGAPPFKRDEAMAVMYAQLSESAPALTSRRRDLPFAADPVFAKALAKAPADRYGSCRDFSDALRAAFGLRPYDSGPTELPSGEHPATQVVRPSGPSAGGGPAAGDYVGQGAGQGAGQGGHPGQGAYPGPGYAGDTNQRQSPTAYH